MQVDDQVVDDAAGRRRRSTACTAPGPGPIRPRSLVRQALTNAGRAGPARRSPCPGGRRRRGRPPRGRRRARATPPPAYSIGIAQPPKSASLAPARRAGRAGARCRRRLTGQTLSRLRGPGYDAEGRRATSPDQDRIRRATDSASPTRWLRCGRRRRRRRRQGPRRAAARPRRRGGRPALGGTLLPALADLGRDRRGRGRGHPAALLRRSGRPAGRRSARPGSARRGAAPTARGRCAGPPAPRAARWPARARGRLLAAGRRRRRRGARRAVARGRAARRLRVHRLQDRDPADRQGRRAEVVAGHARTPPTPRPRRAGCAPVVADAVAAGPRPGQHPAQRPATRPSSPTAAPRPARGSACPSRSSTRTQLRARRLRRHPRRRPGLGPPAAAGRSSPTAARRPRRKIALVGKGITFDTGGISIKPAAKMEDMKSDMAGAAAVIATVVPRSPQLGPAGRGHRRPCRSPRTCPAAAPTGRPTSLTFRNGKKAEIPNTDAEGRVVLADAIARAAEDDPDVRSWTSPR